jgi:hypothetical protein
MTQSSRTMLWTIVHVLGILILLFFANIDQFPIIITGYSISFIAFFFLLRTIDSVKAGLHIGWGIRIAAIFAFPLLSDDIYRFIWDGWLINEFVNPFAYLPIDVPLNFATFQNYLLESMNSPEYYSVYPTILQLMFAITVLIIPTSIIGQSIVLKLMLLGFEIITVRYALKILRHFNKDSRLILLYFLNPLVIVELMGNLHMELVMISGFSVLLYYFFCGARGPKKAIISAFALSFSVAAKLITLIAVPFLIKRLIQNRRINKLVQFFGWFALFFALFFIPMFLLNYENFGKGLDLYFQKFEFNASIYYLIRSVGFWIKGYNIIGSLGPSLAILAAITILSIAFFEKKTSLESLSTSMLFGLSAYYFLSTTVHPWYTALLVFLSVFSGYRFAIFWSFLAVLSYAKYYQGGVYYFPAITVEYVLLFGAIAHELYIRQLDPRRSLLKI